jgi:hypothetical protein
MSKSALSPDCLSTTTEKAEHVVPNPAKALVKNMPTGMYMTCVICNIRQQNPPPKDSVVKRFCLKEGPPAKCEVCCSCEHCNIRRDTNHFLHSSDDFFDFVVRSSVGGFAPVQYQ